MNNAINLPIPKVGEYWPGQGGVNAGLMQGRDGQPDYFLILATDEKACFKGVAWCEFGKKIEGADSEFDGLANTTALVNSEHSCPAAEACAALELEGHKDFYLPARAELDLLWLNVRDLFEKRFHWSSTQSSAYSAWYQYFDVGNQGSYGKVNEGRARAVRRLIVHSSI